MNVALTKSGMQVYQPVGRQAEVFLGSNKVITPVCAGPIVVSEHRAMSRASFDPLEHLDKVARWDIPVTSADIAEAEKVLLRQNTLSEADWADKLAEDFAKIRD